MKELLTVLEAANKLGVSRATIRRWEQAGRLRCIRTKGGHRRIPAEEIDKLLNPPVKGITFGEKR